MKKKKASKVRCAIIGLSMGAWHFDRYKESEHGEVVAVVDVDTSKFARYTPIIGADNCFTDYKKMLKSAKPDLVSVVLPNYLHMPVTIDCLEAGAHVLCEKPMAMTVEEALKMRDAAERCRRQLGLNFNQRFSPEARALKAFVDGGRLGEIYHAYTCWTRRDGIPRFGGWFGQRKLSGGGPLIDLGVHRLDLAMWLMGYPEVMAVSGMTHSRIGVPRAKAARLNFDVEDFAAGFIRLKNGISLLMEASWAGHQREAEGVSMRLMGTEGGLEERDGLWYISSQSTSKYISQISPDTGDRRSTCSEMARCVATGELYSAPAEHGIKIQRILNGLYASMEESREVMYDQAPEIAPLIRRKGR